MNRIKAFELENRIELWCSPELEKKFREIFDIEMLQGTRIEQDDGLIYFQFETTPEKLKATKQAIINGIGKDNGIGDN